MVRAPFGSAIASPLSSAISMVSVATTTPSPIRAASPKTPAMPALTSSRRIEMPVRRRSPRPLRPDRRRLSSVSTSGAALPEAQLRFDGAGRAKSPHADHLVRLQRETKSLRMHFRILERQRDVAVAVVFGLQQNGLQRREKRKCSSGTRRSTMSFASLARAAMRRSTRSFGETQSHTSSGSSVKMVPFDSTCTRRPSSRSASISAERFVVGPTARRRSTRPSGNRRQPRARVARSRRSSQTL